jgi:xanthine dehydrogenase accessory factor
MSQIFKELHQALLNGADSIMVTTLAKSGVERRLHKAETMSRFDSDRSLASGSLIIDRSEEKSVMMERFAPKPQLIVFGGGHISLALVPMATLLELETIVYDDRPFFSNPARFPTACRTICESFESIHQKLVLKNSNLVVIATRGHKHDLECLDFVLRSPEPFYTGMIGSKRRVATVMKLLQDRGFKTERLDKLFSPIGLDIGAVTPAEIAVSILSEIVKVRRRTYQKNGWGNLEIFTDMALIEFLASDPAHGCALITVTQTSGSTPRKAGAKMIAIFDGRTIGSIGGGCAEAEVVRAAREIIGCGGYRFVTIDLTDKADEDGMVCGGHMEALIEDLRVQ